MPWINLFLSSRMYEANGSSMWSIELRLLIDRPTCVKKHSCAHGACGIRWTSGSLCHSLRKFNKEMYKLYEATSFSCLFSIIHNKSWHCVHRVHFIMRDQSHTFHMYMATSSKLAWREIDYSPLLKSYNKSTPFTIMKLFWEFWRDALFFKMLVILQELCVYLYQALLLHVDTRWNFDLDDLLASVSPGAWWAI